MNVINFNKFLNLNIKIGKSCSKKGKIRKHTGNKIRDLKKH